MEIKKKWTIIFLVYAYLKTRTWDPKIKTLRELQSLYDDLVSTEQSDDIEVYLIYNRVIEKPLLEDTAYLLKLSYNPSKKRKFLKRIERYCQKNIAQDPNELSKILQFVRNRSLSFRYMLLTWGHGSVFGIFRQNFLLTALRNTADFENQAMDSRNIMIKDHQVQNEIILEDCQNLVREPTIYELKDILTNDELAGAIADSFPLPETLDILVMMNCDMMSINTCYSLRQCVKIFIAPEGAIDEPGYNYYEIISRIIRFPNLNPDDVAKAVVNSIAVRRERDYPYLNNIEGWAVFAFSMKSYIKILIIVDYLAEILIDFMKRDIKTNPGLIQNIVKRCFPFDAGNLTSMIDLHNCLCFLYDELKISALNLLDFELQNIVNGAVLAEHIGINLYNTREREYISNVIPCGVAIYFPSDKSLLLAESFHIFIAKNARMRSSYFSNTKWFEFICLYLRLLP